MTERVSPWLARLSLAACALCGAAASIAAVGGNLWQSDFNAAFNEAVRSRRPLLIHFYGQQCPPCRRMEQEVLHQPEIVDLLSTQFVAVKVDAGNPANVMGGELVQRFGVHALPTDVIVDPLSGRILSQAEGYQDFLRYRTTAVRARTRFDQAHQVLVVEQTPKSEPPTELADPHDDIQLGDPQSLIGMDGFSPVALGAERQWVVGKPEFAFEFKGVTYYLASEDEQRAFRNRPEDFAPRLLGCDPVVLFETDRAVPGRTDFAAFYDSDLYLFESDESRRRFKINPPKYTRIEHVLRIDNIQRIARQPSQDRQVQ